MAVTTRVERPVTGVHQIELTSRCNLRCPYCPSRSLGTSNTPFADRPQLDMTEEVFDRALAWVDYFARAGTQGRELNLAGIGESTLHPRLLDFVAAARRVLGPDRLICFATNGLAFTEEIAAGLVRHRPVAVDVSLHRPEKAALALRVVEQYGLKRFVSIDPSVRSNDWGGQVDWPVSPHYPVCETWLRDGRVFVFADGRVSACCIDATGAGVLAHVRDDPAGARTRSYSLCSTCHHTLDADAERRITAGGGTVRPAADAPAALPSR